VNTSMLRRARRCFNSDLVPAHINRANRLQWVRAVRQLGSKWLLATPVTKESKQ